MELTADRNHRPAAKMLISSISNRKIHCCFLLLILFILIILALPLLLIWVANNNYQAHHDRLNSQIMWASSSQDEEEIATATNDTTIPQLANNETEAQQETPKASSGTLDGQTVGLNCTQFAILNNLTLANEDLQCPASSWPHRCRSCPLLCIEQRWNCDGKRDCPDGSDEGSCHDSTGAAKVIFTNIWATANSKKANSSLFKPESCTFEQFVEERCPCDYTDPRVVICENLDINRIPDTIQSSVFKIKMSNNSISTIDHAKWPKSLSTLVLVNNSITHIGPRAFELAPHLKLLFLTHNMIGHFHQEALFGLSQLTWLQVEANRLETFESNSLLHTPNIAKLYLSENMIDLPETTKFDRCCQNLRELLLDHNRISLIRSHWFSNMTSLMWLSLSHNEIGFIEDGSFDWNLSLEELNLSFNRIKVINSQVFARNLGIKRLHLSNNPLRSLPKDAFNELLRLQSLNLTDVYFDSIEKETFAGLELAFIYFAKFRFCHYASHARVCLPLTDGLSSTQELLVFPILKAAVRIVALVCCLGNVFVFVWRSVSPHEHHTLSLFIRNLSIADLMMGIYLAAIGYKDWQFQEKGFRPHAIEWMSSGACTFIGFIAILSSELSVFVLTIITIERYRSIVSTRILEEEDQKRRARVYLTLAWIFSIMIASYPLLEWLLSNSDFYATNGLCLPLHIDQPFMPGWQYSAVVYLGINFLAVIIIIYLYVRMYARIMQARQQACPYGAMKREDAILATRFFFIVITDCVCWIPIVIIKIMALANVSIPSSIYGWLVVFIIPINSALNPIVYTLAAPTSMRAAICRWFKRTCDQFDQLTARTSGSRYSSHSSSSVESATMANMIDVLGFRRKNTGSTNSTTIDTFDTSCAITCSSKPSVESALIHYDCNGSAPNHHQFVGAPMGTKTTIGTMDLHGLGDAMLAKRRIRQHERRETMDAVKPGFLAPSSLDLDCCHRPTNGGNRQHLEPAHIGLNKLDSLESHRRRRRQYAASSTAASTSFSDNSTNGAASTNGSAAESKLNSAQADYLSNYGDNATDNGGAQLLIDRTTGGASLVSSGGDRSSTSSSSGSINTNTGASCRDEDLPAKHGQRKQYRRRLAGLANNASPVMVHPHRVLIQDGNSASDLLEALDPLQQRRSTMDFSAELVAKSALKQRPALYQHPANLQQRRFTEFAQTDGVCGRHHVDDETLVTETTTSLDILLAPGPEQQSLMGLTGGRHQSSGISFDSKDSQTCLLSGARKG